MEDTNARAANAAPVLSPAQQTHRNSAVTAMVLGISSLVLFFMPVINIAALVVAIIGLVRARKNRAFALANDIKEDPMNTAGYICSICGIVLAGLSVLFFLLAIAVFSLLIGTVATTLPPITDVIPSITDAIGQVTSAAFGAML